MSHIDIIYGCVHIMQTDIDIVRGSRLSVAMSSTEKAESYTNNNMTI